MPNFKKIIIISSEYPPLPGGIGIHCFQLSQTLRKRNWQVKIITNQRGSVDEERYFDNSYPLDVYRIKRKKLVLFTYLDRLLKSIYFLFKFQPEVVIFSGQFSLWMIPVFKIVRPKVKLISVAHGSEILKGGWFKRKLTSKGFELSHKVICVSSYTLKVLNNNTNVKSSIVINNGFFGKLTNTEQEPKAKAQNIQLVTIGNLSPRKGQLNVVHALPELLKVFPNLVYHMVGIPTIKDKIIKVASDLGVSKHIKIYGVLQNEEINTILDKSSIFIMLSNHLSDGDFEGFGIAILEANAKGLPAIGSKNSGISDAIMHGYSGLCISPGNISELIDAIKRIHLNYNDFSKNAIEWSKNFEWDKVIVHYEEVLL